MVSKGNEIRPFNNMEFNENWEYRRTHKDLPVIALTARAMRGDKEKCIAAGMNDYISKPIDPQKLINTLDKWLENDTAKSYRAESHDKVEREEDCHEDVPDVFDRDGLLDRLMGDYDAVKSLIRLWSETTTAKIDELRKAIDKKDMRQILHLSHSVKGSSATIGAHAVSVAAGTIEKRASDKSLHEIEQLYDKLLQDFERACKEMKRGLHSHS